VIVFSRLQPNRIDFSRSDFVRAATKVTAVHGTARSHALRARAA